jgi:predicted regulator of Ras-like GTPase activity (Roadblock/LC7/MglB family)
MAVEELFADIRTTNGYLASGLMTFTGDLIYSQSNDATIDVELVGATLNDIFRSAHAASNQLTGHPCSQLIIQTPASHIIMNCSGVDSVAHLHSIVVVKSDGNRTLIELNVKKMLPKAIEEIG